MISRSLLGGLLLLSGNVLAQFTEDFSDGDFTANPVWTSSNESGAGFDFLVTAGELQSNGPSATATLWISNANLDGFASNETTWEFKARYLTSGPSGSNNIRIYLVSDQTDLTSSPQGYYIQLGEGGSDDGIDFYKTSSGTALITDPNPSVASGIDVNIRVSRTASGDWTLEADPAGGTSFVTIGTVNDTEFTTGSNFGFVVEHSSTRNQDFYFDDISVTSIDLSPPSVSSIDVLSNTEIDVEFSENLDQASAEILANYTVNNGIANPATATLDASGNVVHLTFATSFANASTYQLTVQNIEDQSGNAITSEMEEFFYFQEEPAVYKDLLISEIFADPTPANDLPEAEFVELFNNSNKVFDLSVWSFSDASSTSLLPSYFIGPGEYVIVCPQSDVAEWTSFGEVIGLSDFPSLNNTGDQLSILDNNSSLIDTVAYNNDWYNDEVKDDGGWTLELIDPTNFCGEEENWTASVASEGGTPGTQNSVFDNRFDTTPPFLASASIISADSVQLVFNQRLDPTTVQVSDFSFDQGVAIASVSISTEPGIVELVLASNLDVNTTYTVSAIEVSDCSGNSLTTDDAEVILVQGAEPEYKDIIINEILANPEPQNDLPAVEFVEFFNRGNKIFDLEGWAFSDATSTGILPKRPIFPDEYIILCPIESVNEFEGIEKVVGLEAWPSLNNGGDQISLRNNSGILVDSVNYDDNWHNSSAKQDGGWSLELIDPNNECGEEENWTTSEDLAGGTPGEQNSVFNQNPDLQGPKLIQALALKEDSLVLRFNEKLDAASALTASYIITPDVSIDAKSITPRLREVVLNLSTPIEPGQIYNVRVMNLLDCSGNNIDAENSIEFGLLETASESDVVINEILFNPRSGGEDFVEVLNKSDKYINIGSWILANGELVNDSLVFDTQRLVGEKDFVIEPGQYLVFTGEPIVIKEQYPQGKEDRFFELSSLPSFPNVEGMVILADADTLPIDFFMYTEDYHSSLLDELDGVSLERVSFEAETNSTDNWKSAVASVGFATPGYQNSQSRSNITQASGSIVVEPKVIIPDGSGQNEFATISYNFNSPGQVATVSVLDVQGRLVKEITNNNFLGSEGFFTWDGTDHGGRKARVGYYLILFEVFDATGKKEVFKEKVVIGSKF